jgi:hypothetical protein
VHEDIAKHRHIERDAGETETDRDRNGDKSGYRDTAERGRETCSCLVTVSAEM